MIRFIPIRKRDLLADARGHGAMLEKALTRKPVCRFVSLCGTAGDTLIAVLESCGPEEADDREFVFSPLEADSESFEGVSAAVRRRYEADYSTLATFFINRTMWGLFARKKR